MLRKILVTGILSLNLTACTFISETGEVVEEVGSAVETAGDKRKGTFIGTVAKVGGSVYKFVGGAIQKVSEKKQEEELGDSTSSQTVGVLKEVNSAAVSGFISATENHDKDEVLRVQKKLIGFGYDPGTPDGIMGKNTKNALSAFQQDQNLAVSGEIDEATEQALGL